MIGSNAIILLSLSVSVLSLFFRNMIKEDDEWTLEIFKGKIFHSVLLLHTLLHLIFVVGYNSILKLYPDVLAYSRIYLPVLVGIAAFSFLPRALHYKLAQFFPRQVTFSAPEKTSHYSYNVYFTLFITILVLALLLVVILGYLTIINGVRLD